jgi:hypothetical protein
MTATKIEWLWGAVVLLLIAYDVVIGIPSRVFALILIALLIWALVDLNKRLEALEHKSVGRLDELANRFDELNKRLRWVEFKFFGADRDDIFSAEWSARHDASEYEPLK